MRFLKRIEKIKLENKDKIVLARCGAFVVAIGNDARVLSKVFGLKRTCQKKEVCKVGIPVTYTLKYLELIKDKGYGYVLYDYSKETKESKLKLIPKVEVYVEYVINMIIKLPRTEKFSIGSEYKLSLYKMLEEIMYLNKMDKASNVSVIAVLNRIDSLLMVQRIYLRIMVKNKWIDKKKFNTSMGLIYEIGKILGGLIKFYAKNNKK